MTSVVPMKLVPVSMNNVSNPTNLVGSVSEPKTNSEFPTIAETDISFKKKPNSSENLTNLDSELLSILHNKHLSDDAKAKLYWIALHKSEIYKDKSMWSEPTIVELRENRFIPIPVPIKTTTKQQEDIPKVGVKRKLIPDEIGEDGEEGVSSSKRIRTDQTPVPELKKMAAAAISRKRKLPETEEQSSEKELKRMALVNRIEDGEINQDELDRQMDLIENPPIQLPETLSGPLVVTDQQNQQPQQQQQQQQQPIIQQISKPINYTPEPLDFSDRLIEETLPDWLRGFYEKLESKVKNIARKNLIKNLIEKIIAKDPEFIIHNRTVLTGRKLEWKGDPISLFSQVITDKATRTNKEFVDYLI